MPVTALVFCGSKREESVARRAWRRWTVLSSILSFLSLAGLVPADAFQGCAPALNESRRAAQTTRPNVPCWLEPTAAAIGSFEAVADTGVVTLLWETASETNEAGFTILRRHVRTGRTERLNRFLIPAQGTPSRGASYAFVDTTPMNGVEYEYTLEEWTRHDDIQLHPARRVVPNPVNPTLRLVSPAYNEAARSTVRFEWQVPGRMRFTLQLSPEASFSGPATLHLGAGVRTYRALTSREMSQIRSMADGGEGGIYWRVTGKDARGMIFESQTHFLEGPAVIRGLKLVAGR